MLKRITHDLLNLFRPDDSSGRRDDGINLHLSYLRQTTAEARTDFINTHQARLIRLISREESQEARIRGLTTYVRFISEFSDKQLEQLGADSASSERNFALSPLVDRVLELAIDLAERRNGRAASEEIYALAGYSAWLTALYYNLICISPGSMWWSGCYRIFSVIREQGWNELKSPFKGITMETLFKRILLLNISTANRHPLAKRRFILHLVNALANDLYLVRLGEQESLANEFSFDLDKNRPPHFMGEDILEDDEHGNVWIVKTDLLKKAALALVKQAQGDKDSAFDVNLATQLISDWTHPPQRKSPRFVTDKKNDLVSTFLFSAVDRDGREDLLEPLFAGQPVTESGYAIEMKAINVSASGIQLESRGVSHDTIRVGDLIAVLDFTEQWKMGVVRWISVMGHGRIRYGIEWFGKKMRAVTVLMETSTGHHMEQQALHFSASGRDSREKEGFTLVYRKEFNRLYEVVVIRDETGSEHLDVACVLFQSQSFNVVYATAL